jgi:hypothetical protein
MNIHQLKGRDLCGWQVRTGFYLTTTHRFFPGSFFAITNQNEQIVVCFSVEDLQKVFEKLPKRKTTISKGDFLFNEKEWLIVQTIDNLFPDNFFIAFGEALENSLKKEVFFGWQRGFIATIHDNHETTSEKRDY